MTKTQLLAQIAVATLPGLLAKEAQGVPAAPEAAKFVASYLLELWKQVGPVIDEFTWTGSPSSPSDGQAR